MVVLFCIILAPPQCFGGAYPKPLIIKPLLTLWASTVNIRIRKMSHVMVGENALKFQTKRIIKKNLGKHATNPPLINHRYVAYIDNPQLIYLQGCG